VNDWTNRRPIIGLDEGDLWYIDFLGNFNPCGDYDWEENLVVWLALEELREVHVQLAEFFLQMDGNHSLSCDMDEDCTCRDAP